MTSAPSNPTPAFRHRHLLGIEGLSHLEILHLLDKAEEEVLVSRQVEKKKNVLRGRTQKIGRASCRERVS
jgi:aspartate carbamoyltransferase catalytic subunit